MHKSSSRNTKQLGKICVSSGSRNRIDIISIITSKRLRWGQDVAHTVNNRNAFWVSWGNLNKDNAWKKLAQKE
jgi:hypothetical protein